MINSIKICVVFLWDMVGPTNTLATAPIDHNKCLPHVLGCLKVRLGGSRRHDRKWLLGLSEHNERLVILLVGSCATVIESMQRIQKGTSIIQMLGCYYRVGCYKFSGILGTLFFLWSTWWEEANETQFGEIGGHLWWWPGLKRLLVKRMIFINILSNHFQLYRPGHHQRWYPICPNWVSLASSQ